MLQEVQANAADKVVFVEVDCRKAAVFCQKHEAGRGGWPTLKHFTAETGSEGQRYQQKTDQRVCDEMKDPKAVAAWVEEIGGVNPMQGAAKNAEL